MTTQQAESAIAFVEQLKEEGFSQLPVLPATKRICQIWGDRNDLRRWVVFNNGRRAEYYNRLGFRSAGDWIEIRAIEFQDGTEIESAKEAMNAAIL